MKSAKPSKTKTIKPAKSAVGRPKDTAKREGIVRAGSDLFLKNGYTLTSMEAVAKKAGVSKLTIYSHFANKDELFKEVIRQRCDKLTPEDFASLSKTPVEKALMQLGLNFTSLIFRPDSIRLHCIMQAEAVRHPKVVQIFFEAGPKRVRAAFGELLKSWHEQGQLSVPNIAKATDQFFSLLKGEMMMHIILLRTPMPSEAELKLHVRATVDFFLAGYATNKKQK